MRELSKYFVGVGEVRGFTFKQVFASPDGYVYEVRCSKDAKPHYEAFLRKENSQFGVISYPSAKAFGLWAWTCDTLERAKNKLLMRTKRKQAVLPQSGGKIPETKKNP